MVGTDGADMSETFGLLADETRLETIRVLGEAGRLRDFRSLSFSTLQERVGVRDNGRFNYHLTKLLGQFVRQTEEGYALTVPGVQVYQALKAGSYSDHDPVGPLETAIDCEDCGTPLTAEYVDFEFELGCPTCGEAYHRYVLTPGTVGTDQPGDLLASAHRRIKRDCFSMRQGFCPYCAGSVAAELTDDPPRTPGVHGRPTPPVWVMLSCDRCDWHMTSWVAVQLLVYPDVAAAFASEGVDVFEVPPWSPRLSTRETVESTDPWRVRVAITVDDAVREVTVDGDLRVCGIE